MSAKQVSEAFVDRHVRRMGTWWRELDLDDAKLKKETKLDGQKLATDLIEARTKISIERSISIATNVSLEVYDPEYSLQNGVLPRSQRDEGMVLELNGVRFGLVKMAFTWPNVTMTFEDEIVVWLRRYMKALKISRGDMTRAEFIFRMMREVKEGSIPFYCPELHKKQPVARSQDVGKVHGKKGLTTQDQLTVKGRPATSDQLRTCTEVLDACVEFRAPKEAMIAAIACIIEERTARNGAGGDRDSTGAFQQRKSTGWKGNLTNIETQVKNFLIDAPTTPFLKVLKHPEFKNKDMGYQISETQRDYSYGSVYQGKHYQARREEASAIVSAYGSSGPTERFKNYAFSRGQANQPESTWDAALRLADEVGWRFFSDLGVAYFLSEKDLAAAGSDTKISPQMPGVTVDYDVDWGKRASTAQVTVQAAPWTTAPGLPILIEDAGMADGRWIVESMTKTGGDVEDVLQLKRAAPERKEPAPETASRGLSNDKISAVEQRAEELNSQHRRYVWGGGHNLTTAAALQDYKGGLDCSTSIAYILNIAPRVSGEFASWGKEGVGPRDGVTVYYNDDHVWAMVKGRPFGTSGSNPGGGPGWFPKSIASAAYKARFKARHL